MKKSKKIIIITTVVLIVVAASAAGIYIAVSNNNKKHTVEAVPIEYVCSYDYDMTESSLSGTVFSGGGQNIRLDENDIINRVLVNEGDTVQAGTPLIELDSNKLKLDLDACSLALQQDDLDIQLANKMLSKYQNATPYTQPETNDEPESEDSGYIDSTNIISEINSISQAFEGDGSTENPYKFKCSGDCTLYAPIFKSIEKDNIYVTLYIYSEDIGDFAYTCILSPTGKNTSIKDDYSWKVGNIYTLADGTETIQLNNTMPTVPCEFSTYVPDVPEDTDDILPDDTDDMDDTNDDSTSDSIDGKYTQNELNQMISDKQKEIADLTIKRKEDELAVKKAQDKYNKATITSTVSGVVTSINADAGSSEPVMVISDSAGLYVKTAVDEYTYASVKIGDTINITSWGESGNQQVKGKITSISPYPTSNNEDYAYSSNKNLSFYPITVLLDDSSELKPDDYVSVSFKETSEEDSQVIGIDKAYIGEENGKKFLYLVDEKGYLKKTYITTGKTIYESYLEIKDSIDTSGYIASPYTKYAKDGAKAKTSDSDMY